MKIVEITESKLHKMSDMLEEMLMLGGKMMSCLSTLESSNESYEGYNYKSKFRSNYNEDMPQARNNRYSVY